MGPSFWPVHFFLVQVVFELGLCGAPGKLCRASSGSSSSQGCTPRGGS